MKILIYPVGEMRANCYVLTCPECNDCIVVDPGDEAEKLLNKIAERSLNVSLILLTHAHFDHMMALEELRSATGAPLALHEYDAPALQDPKKSMMWQFAHMNKPCSPPQRLLHEGDVISLGDERITVMHTPGHTMGSVCYVTSAGIITGDTLFRENIGRYDFYGGNYEALMHSLSRLRDLEGDCRIYPGHGVTSTLSHERESNLYFR